MLGHTRAHMLAFFSVTYDRCGHMHTSWTSRKRSTYNVPCAGKNLVSWWRNIFMCSRNMNALKTKKIRRQPSHKMATQSLLERSKKWTQLSYGLARSTVPCDPPRKKARTTTLTPPVPTPVASTVQSATSTAPTYTYICIACQRAVRVASFGPVSCPSCMGHVLSKPPRQKTYELRAI